VRCVNGIPILTCEEDEREELETKIRPSSAVQTNSARDRPFLIVLAGGSVGEMYRLEPGGDVVIGRGRGATIRIDDEGVSRSHAKLSTRGLEVLVEDLQSANGTRVNGERLKARRLLKDGDKITLGSTTIMKFTYGDDLEENFQRNLLDAALRDALTKAFNKGYFLDRLKTELSFATRHEVPLSLVMLDVDHFKKINDTFGHPAGDEVLVKLASAVRENIPKEAVFARYGGEEFAVLCRKVTVADAGVLAERLRREISAMLVEYEGKRIAVTMSAGVAGVPSVTASGADKLIAAADAALYEAKKQGRNCVVLAHGR
jgi:diguanylate cyclase (GGDEF)-like protein